MRKPLDSGRPQTRAKARDYMINVTLFLTGYTSVANAVKQAERFGMLPMGSRSTEALGETGKEVKCGQGTIVFFEASHSNSPLSMYLKRHRLGLVGISVEVADLKTAQQIVQEGTHKDFKIKRDGKRISFTVPADLAVGSFVEFVQQ
jgi:hypothetical protein